MLLTFSIVSPSETPICLLLELSLAPVQTRFRAGLWGWGFGNSGSVAELADPKRSSPASRIGMRVQGSGLRVWVRV